MKEKYITYKTSDGRTFDVPESYSAVVEHDYPDATIEMRLGDRIFDVPVSSKEDVIKSYGNQIRYSFEDKPESQTSSMMSEPASAFEDTKEEPISFATTPAEKKKKPSFWQRVGESMLRAQNEGFANTQKAEELSEQIGSVQGQGKDNGPSVLESFVKGSGAGWTRTGKGLLDALHILSSNTLYNDPETGAAKKTESYDKQMMDETNAFRNASVMAQETADRLSKEADPTGGEMGFVDLISEGKFGMAMQKGLATMAESMPMTLSAYSPYTMALNMISMAGSNYAEQTLENPEIDAWKRGVYAVGSAAFEQAVEKFADPVFQYIGGGKGAKKITEELAKEIIEKGTKEATENIYKQILRRIGKVGVNTLKGAGGEGLEEVITSGGTDALGAALDFIDRNKDYGFSAQWEQYKKQNPDANKEDFAWAKAKEYADSFIGGALSGAYMSGAASSANEIATSRMESQGRKQMNAARAKGSTLGLANMYDLDEAVKEQADATETVFTDESGEKLLSRDFIDNMSSEDAFNLSLEEDLSNKQKIALRQLANAKAMEEGLTTSLDNSLASTINAQKANIEKATENGKIVVGTVNGQPVYVKGAVVQNGSLTLPTGENGPVIIINAATGEQSSVNTNEIENFTSRDAAEYTGWVEKMFTDKDQQDRQTARTTMSVGAKLKAVTPYAGKKMYVDFGNGLIEVGVQRVLPTGEVIIQGKKGDLGGQSIKTMGVDAFYDSIYRDENGNPIFTDGELEPIESQPTEAPTGTAEANDYRGQAVTILINGKPVEVEVTSQDNTSDRITYEYVDENGNARTGGSTISEFETAIQQASTNESPNPENDVEGINEEPITLELMNWDELLQTNPEEFFKEVQMRFGNSAINFLKEEIEYTKREINSLKGQIGNTLHERAMTSLKIDELQSKINTLSSMVSRLEPAPQNEVESAPVAPETPVAEAPLEPAPEPVEETPIEAPVAETPVEPVEETPVEPEVAPETPVEETPVAPAEQVEETPIQPEPQSTPVAPTPVDNPIEVAKKWEETLISLINRKGIAKEIKIDSARHIGRVIADLFATREEYEAYEAEAADLGEYLSYFDEGVNESFAVRNNQQNTGETPVNSVPLEEEPNGESNGEQETGEVGTGRYTNIGIQGTTVEEGQGEDKGDKGEKGSKSQGTNNKGTKEVEDKYPARKGNATPDLLVKTFGLESVNLPKSKNGQKALNSIYDFLMEMSKMLGISPTSIGQGGWLELRNLRGNAGRSAAHNIRDIFGDIIEVYIELKSSRLSSIAHEWFHSLDRALSYFNTGRIHTAATESLPQTFDGRPEVLAAMDDIIRAIEDSGHPKRIQSIGWPRKHKTYLLRLREMAARAFEQYIEDKFAAAGIIIENYEVNKDNLQQPTAEEMAVIAPAFDKLFEVLQEKEGKTPGTSVLFQIGQEVDEKIEENNTSEVARRLANEAIDMMFEQAGREVVFVTDEQAEQMRKLAGADAEFMISSDKPVFVSNAAVAVMGIKQEKATPAQWLAMIDKAGGLKAGEDKWMGLSDWLKASDKKTLTKQEVLDYIVEHMIQIEEVHYAQDTKVRAEIADAELQMLEKFQPEFDEYVAESEEANGSIFMADHYQYAYNKMLDIYGDDFGLAFGHEDGMLEINDTEAASAVSGVPIPDIREIDPTRENYTTEGLTKKREIAIVVPTIESWGESDEIHFGDAGEGRAVAWVRFGETYTEDTNSDVNDYLKGKYSKEDFEAGNFTEEDWKKLRDARKQGKKVLVIDEIQSKRHQEGRESGYKVSREKADAEMDKFMKRMHEKYEFSSSTPFAEVFNEEEMRELARLTMQQHRATFGGMSVPDAPFDKNWHELAMKRMLRYAAENGYDVIAWTKGEQQAERYNIGTAVEKIILPGGWVENNSDKLNGEKVRPIYFVSKNMYDFSLSVNEEGVVVDGGYAGQNLSDVVGKEMAVKLMTAEPGTSIEGDELRIGGEGMKGFYDKMLPAFMNKYGKKWGIKVADITLPNVEEAGRVMHSVPVTDAMKESVMEGQVMFMKRPNGKVFGWTDGKKIYLTKDGLNPNTKIHEYTHLWAQAMMQKNPNGWQSVKDLLRGTPVWNEVLNDPNYSNIHADEDLVASEVLSRISGRDGSAKLERMAQQMIDEAKGTARKLEARGLIQRMKDALNEFWSWVGTNLFKIEKFDSIEQVTDRVLWDLLNATDLGELSEGQVETQIVTDPKVISELEASPKRTGYRNVVQNEDGTFSSPMAYWLQSPKGGAKTRIETAKFELGKWEEAEENTDLVDERGHITLVKPNKGTIDVAYDPYIHNRLDPVNLQFKDAWKRDDLVYVETEVPETDLESGYHADKALLPVGIHSWSNGDVMLSKYDKPVRIMPWEDVADAWVKRLNGEGVHFDVVPPALRPLLVERGVEILPPHKGMGKDCNDAYKQWKDSISKENSVSLPNVSQAIESGVWNEDALNELDKITEDVEEGKAILKRYTSSELTGLLEGGSLLVRASIISRGSEGDVSSSRRRTESLEERARETIPALISWAKSVGAWREYSERTEEEIAHSYITSGGEAQVFYLGDGKVEKIIGLDYFVDPQLAIDRIAIHNSLFEETLLKVTGFGTNKDGNFAIIVEQPTIIGKHTDNAEIDSYIESIGFKKVDDITRTFANEELYLSDLHEENVLNQDHERYYVIDGDFRLNTPEAGIGGTRQIDDRIVRDESDGLLFRSSGSPITPEMDAEYLAAVERGDMETAQRMVIEAAKLAMPNTKVVDEEGNPLVVYHGTGTDFNMFDENYSSTNTGAKNGTLGFYFTPLRSYAETIVDGDSIIKSVFLNIENPLELGYAKKFDGNYHNGREAKPFNYEDSRNIVDGLEAIRRAVTKKFGSYTRENVSKWKSLVESYYDGVFVMTGDTADFLSTLIPSMQYIAFNPSQIKSADPVTYDDAGNVIPLSERFNPENPDIRYRKVESQNAAVDNLVGEARLRAIEHAVNAEASKLGVKVTYKTRSEMPKGHHNEKGYYNPNTGEIVVCTENASSIADAIQTILHEAVAHKGLRQLMGDKFNEFINRVYESLNAETKAKVDARAAAEYGGDTAVAMEEYMATLAESTDFNNDTLWDKIKSIFEDIINAILGRNDIKIGDNELRYILRASYNNMVNPRGMETIRGWAQDQMMREDYGINKATHEKLYRTGIDPTEAASETAKEVYDNVVHDNWQEFQRQFQDAMQPVRIAIDAIQQETGNVPIEDYENYILIQNQASSRSRVEIDEFHRKYYSPIIEQVNAIIDKIMTARGYKINDKKKRAEVYAEVKQYLIAKHGLERNAYYQSTKTKMVDGEEVPDMRDYSGLTTLFGMSPKDFEAAEEAAQEFVDKFEVEVGDATDALWKKINTATSKTLRHSYESGIISRQQYDDISGMFDFYIPLRGFDETTAEDVYSYARFEGNRFSAAVQTAKGRTSLANDPIAYIMNMAESEIAQGNKNRAKQALYHFILNRPVTDADGNQTQNSLMQVENVWYIKSVDGFGREVYTIAHPDHSAGETMQEFEAKMKALAETGEAVKSKKGKVDVGMRFQKPTNANEHYIYLKVNGVEKAIYVNGDPKAAQAVNGTFAEPLGEGAQRFRDVQRVLSQTFTNYSIEFTARNYMRDLIYSHINIGVRESDPTYRRRFRQNWRKNNLGTMLKLIKAYRAGELEGRQLTEVEAAFVEFMANGGQTGYTLINSIEAHKIDLERAIENMQKGVVNGGVKDSTIFKFTLGNIELFNEASELVTRFAAFKTSRDMGRSVVQSISDAKEVTVNFNTRGAQDGKGWMGVAARYLGWSKFFFNASVQGVQNITAMARANKLRFCGVVGGIAATGFMMPLLTGVIYGMLSGDDDDEKNPYWNIPEYERQNNICIVIGDGKYVKIPLPIGFREIYALGDMTAALVFDKTFRRDATRVGVDMANKIASVVLPINPLESSVNGLSLWHTALNTGLPSSLQFLVQNATNIDWKGAPIQKEYQYNKDDPQWMKAFESNPDWMVGLSKWCNEHIGTGDMKGMDWSPEKLDNTLSNLFGGIYSLVKKTGKSFSMIWNEENRNLSNIPLAGVILGSGADSDDRYITNEYYEGKEYYDDRIGFIKRRAEKFGYDLDDVFKKEKGKQHPKMHEIYDNKEYEFMKAWYLAHEGNPIGESKQARAGLDKLHNEIKKLEKEIAKKENPSPKQTEKLSRLQQEYEDYRREVVDELLKIE